MPGGVRAAEELKLLKLLQQEVNLRTRRLDEAIGAAKSLTPAEQQEFSDLGQGQGRLADLVMQMLPAADAEKLAPDLQRELGRAAVSEDDNPLLAIVQEMRAVQGRLGHKDAGPDTQIAQQEIVDRIDQLLKKAQAMCRGGASPSNPQANNRPQPGQPKATNQPGKINPKPTPIKNDAKDKPATRGQPEKQPRQPPDLQHSAGWGVLPERERARVLQIPSDQFLPKYEQMIEDYYRRLSRQPGEDESQAGDSGGSGE